MRPGRPPLLYCRVGGVAHTMTRGATSPASMLAFSFVRNSRSRSRNFAMLSLAASLAPCCRIRMSGGTRFRSSSPCCRRWSDPWYSAPGSGVSVREVVVSPRTWLQRFLD